MTRLSAASRIGALFTDIKSGKAPPSWPSGDPVFDHIEIGPGRIITIAAPPGAGKTALAGQWTVGMLRSNTDLRVLNCNVEMSPDALLMRQLSRISDVELTKIQRRRVDPPDVRRVGDAVRLIESIGDRWEFAPDPSNLSSITRDGADFGPDVIVLDYAQRINPACKTDGARERMNALMSELRLLADVGRIGFIVIAAVGRTKDNKGRSSYSGDHLTMANLRESSELEFGSDDVLIMAPSDDGAANAPVRQIVLKHEKCRHGEPKELGLLFHRRIQRFEVDPFSTVSPSAMLVGGAGVVPSNGRNSF